MDRHNRKNVLIRIYLLLLCIMIAAGGAFTVQRIQSESLPVKPLDVVSMTIDLVVIILVVIFTAGSMADKARPREKNYAFILSIFSIAVLSFFDLITLNADGMKPSSVNLTLLSNSGYYLVTICCIQTFALYLHKIVPEKSSRAYLFFWCVRIYFLILLAVVMVNIKTGILFTAEDGIYRDGPLAMGSFVAPAVFIAAILRGISKQKIASSEKIAIALYVFLPMTGCVFQMVFYKFSFLPMCTLITVCIMYVSVHIKQSILIAEKNSTIREKETTIMLSQLQPHFLYNSLTSIACLCDLDPQKAKELTMSFSKYLRGNLNALKSESLVPFSRELDHIKNYLDIELVRFANRLKVEYDIQTEDFMLPTLAVQPMVENAVKHGVTMRAKGGTVKLSVKDTEKAIVITVEDDGVGFDMNEVNWEDGTHIGVMNVRDRLKSLCSGTLDIYSVRGEGTKTTITIPKKKKNNY